MLRRVFRTGILAGGAAGLVATVAQMLGTAPLIRAAEVYESGLAAPESILADPRRAVLTLAINLLVGVGFGLMLAGAFALARRPIDLGAGALWGAAGFLAFALLPALGLPPELPGVPAAPLVPRQLWWLLTVGCSLAGLYALFARRGPGWWAGGGALLLLPHLIGAPLPPDSASAVPAELAARFVAVSLATSLLFWLVLGAASGALFRRAA